MEWLNKYRDQTFILMSNKLLKKKQLYTEHPSVSLNDFDSTKPSTFTDSTSENLGQRLMPMH